MTGLERPNARFVPQVQCGPGRWITAWTGQHAEHYTYRQAQAWQQACLRRARNPHVPWGLRAEARLEALRFHRILRARGVRRYWLGVLS